MDEFQEEISEAFEKVDFVLRAYFEKEMQNDNFTECKDIDNLIYGLQHYKCRILKDYMENKE